MTGYIDGLLLGVVIGMIGGVLFGFLMSHIGTNAWWEANIVARNLAIYCPLDGHFAFKGECDK